MAALAVVCLAEKGTSALCFATILQASRGWL